MTSDYLALNELSTGALVYVRTSEILTVTEQSTGSALTFTSGQGLKVVQPPSAIFAQMRSRIPLPAGQP